MPEAILPRRRGNTSRGYVAARAEMAQRRENLSLALDTNEFVDTLRAVIEEAVPLNDKAVWPADIAELAGKIERERAGGLRSFEQPVRNKDRQLVVAGLPPGLQVAMDDPRYH